MAKAYGGVLGGASGKVGNLVFYRYRGRDYVRAAPRKIGKKNFKTDPRYINTRKTAAEFSRSGKAVKLIHGIMNRFGFTTEDGSSFWRMQAVMMQVIKGDTSNEWGMRTVPEGDLDRLEGFSFIEKVRIGASVDTIVDYNSRSGLLTISVNLPLFDDELNGALVGGDYTVSVLAMAINFNAEKFNAVVLDGQSVDSSNGNTRVKLKGNFKTDTKVPLLVVTRIQSTPEYGKPVGSSRYDMLTLSNVVWPSS